MEFNVNGWSFSCAQLVGAPRRERETLSRLEASFLPRGSLFSLPLSPVSRLPSQKKNRINPVRVLPPGEQFRAVGERRVQRWAWIQISVAHWRVMGRKGSGRRTPRVDLQNDRRISPRGWIRAPLRRRLVFLGISGILEDFPRISMLLRTTSVRKKGRKDSKTNLLLWEKRYWLPVLTSAYHSGFHMSRLDYDFLETKSSEENRCHWRREALFPPGDLQLLFGWLLACETGDYLQFWG